MKNTATAEAFARRATRPHIRNVLLAMLSLAITASSLSVPTIANAADAKQEAVRVEAAKYGMTVEFSKGACEAKTACYSGGTVMRFNTDKMASATASQLVQAAKHEAAHYRIATTCRTSYPAIAGGLTTTRYHNGSKNNEYIFEYVTDAYANLYNGMNAANGWYWYDSRVTAAERESYKATARLVYDGQCVTASRAPASWIDANGDGIPDDAALPINSDIDRNGYPDIVGLGYAGILASRNSAGSFLSGSQVSAEPRLNYTGSAGFWWEYETPSTITDLNADGYPDFLQFGVYGVTVALNDKTGKFVNAQRVLNAFGSDSFAGGWSTSNHPRMLSDVNNDSFPDIVGFANNGVYVALNNKKGGFDSAILKLSGHFGPSPAAGGWSVSQHPRILSDVNNDGYPDIVGFANNGVHVALNNKNGGFNTPSLKLDRYFGYSPNAGGWFVGQHIRLLSDINNDGYPDIVGFAHNGVHVALNNKSGGFNAPSIILDGYFGYSAYAGGWFINEHPRMLVDVNNDKYPDIVGFANNGVYVALNNKSGGFNAPNLKLGGYFGSNPIAGGWSVEDHPRLLVDVNNDKYPDIVGFANMGVYVAVNNKSGGFNIPSLKYGDYGKSAGGWRGDKFPRFIG